MIFKNKVKYQMYKILVEFNKCHNIYETEIIICKNLNINENDFSFALRQCVENHFFDGIDCSIMETNNTVFEYKDYIFITYSGYEFIKNYYSFFKKLLWHFFVVITTAIITVIISNYLSETNQAGNFCNNSTKNEFVCIPVSNNSD